MSLCLYHAPQNEYLEGEHGTPMLESCLTFLAMLVNVRTNLGEPFIIKKFEKKLLYFSLCLIRELFIFIPGLSDPEMSRLEMVTLLCTGDKTHSQLMELMPERCGTTQNRDFESVLTAVRSLTDFLSKSIFN